MKGSVFLQLKKGQKRKLLAFFENDKKQRYSEREKTGAADRSCFILLHFLFHNLIF